MSVSFWISDKTGDGGKRAARFLAQLEAKNIPAKAGFPTSLDGEGVLLSHFADLTEEQRKAVDCLVKTSAAVVLYSGAFLQSRNEQVCGGNVRYRPLSHVEWMIRQAGANWTSQQVQAALDPSQSRQWSSGFNTLAILSFCASAPVSTHEARERQRAWASEPDRWRQATHGLDLSLLRSIAEFNGKSAVTGLIDWIERSGTSPPEFGVATREASELV